MGDDGQRPCKEKVSAPATGDNSIKAAIVELDERTYRRTMMQTNAMATIGDGSRQSYRAFVAETDRLFALMEGLKRCLPSKRPALSSHEQGEG